MKKQQNISLARSIHPVKTPKVQKTPSAKRRNALFRAGAALIAAVLLLALSEFSFLDLIKGPAETSSLQKEETGTFVKCNVLAIMGYYGDGSGKYAVVPMNGQFVTVHFTKRYLNSADTIEADTLKYVNGDISSLDSYVTVQGMVGTLDDALSSELYDWFSENKDWMVKDGVIADTDDYSEYLSDTVLEVDTVNALHQNLVVALTGLAVLFLIYMLIELILLCVGFYTEKLSPAAEAAVGCPKGSVSDPDEIAAPEPEKDAEAAPECIKSEDNAENGSGSGDDCTNIAEENE